MTHDLERDAIRECVERGLFLGLSDEDEMICLGERWMAKRAPPRSRWTERQQEAILSLSHLLEETKAPYNDPDSLFLLYRWFGPFCARWKGTDPASVMNDGDS